MDEIRKKTIDFLKSNQGCYSVKTIIKEIFNINEQADFRLTFDVKEGTIIMISNNPNANVIVGDAIGEITLMLSYIKELSDNGCAMIYQINKNDKIIIGNSKIKDESNNHYCITNDLILKYIDKEIMVISDKLQDYIDRDCKSFNDYYNHESLQISRKTLNASKINMWIAIIATFVSIICNLLTCICR